MKSSMRQWRRLVLLAMLAWVLLFLALLSYFLDARVDEPLTSAGSLLSQHPDTRRLASIQASHQQHAILGSRPELALPLTTTYPREKPELEPSASSTTPETSLEVSHSPNSAPYAVYGSQEASRQDYLDPQSLAAWSSFGTENVGSHSDPAVQSRERTSQTAEENEDEEGRVSADMLSPRLQRAMKDYLSANKHHVSYSGHRRTAQSAKELLCQIKAQARLRTVDGSEQPFSSLGWARLVPSVPLEQLQDQSSFKTCAVVTSAGAILRSGLGKEIENTNCFQKTDYCILQYTSCGNVVSKMKKGFLLRNMDVLANFLAVFLSILRCRSLEESLVCPKKRQTFRIFWVAFIVIRWIFFCVQLDILACQ
uniref:Beta-galactoside alpha-2,6-sialyltransferase 2 n=1 Tax=Amphiprion ocellaris TaxID=80972 RepID=A0AAQ5XVW9_AMPOC